MSETPNLIQQRITRQMDDLLKADRDPIAALWTMWAREAPACADEFVAVLIGQFCAVRALARLRGRQE